MKHVSKQHINLGNITSADLIVRTGYQIGKAPVLTMMAAQLNANEVILALIVSISTISGMILKPFIGFLSDNLGRKLWLFVGTVIFAGVPFLYGFIETPTQLIGIRIFHGVATAIYGPVTLAYVAEIKYNRFGRNFGIFSLARNSSYIIGPLIGGWLLLNYDPVHAYTVIGFMSILGFMPLIFLSEQRRSNTNDIYSSYQTSSILQTDEHSKSKNLSTKEYTKKENNKLTKIIISLTELRNKSIWIAGGSESLGLMATYGAKVFVPLHLIVTQNNIFTAATFIAMQHAKQMVISAFSGRLWDKTAYIYGICLGITFLGIGINLIPLVGSSAISIPITAIIIGIGMGFIQPSASSYIATNVNRNSLGFSIGFSGTLKNMSKILGPIFLGILITYFGYANSLHILGIATILGIIPILFVLKIAK